MNAPASARRMATACVYPLVRRAARAYVAGDTLDDALRVSKKLAMAGTRSTIGYWDGPSDSPRNVAAIYRDALTALSGSQNYLSIKFTALGLSGDLLAEVAAAARTANVRLHFDAMEPASAEPTKAAVERLLTSGDHGELSYTLPARWRRSVDDAHWAIQRGLAVRVVKGQWADLLDSNGADPSRDGRTGYLEVIDALAGRARHVAVASHDAPLVANALERLQTAGTSRELELLHGLPQRGPLRIARRLGVSARIYVPYGQSFLPYALSRAVRNPRTLWWLLRDLASAPFSR